MIDWYNYIVQHNPTPHGFQTGRGAAYETPLRDKTHGRIYRVVYKDARPSRPPALDPDRPDTLVAALANDNQFWRMHAQRLLVEHLKAGATPASDQVIGSLIELASNKSVDAIGLNAAGDPRALALKGIGAFDGSNPAAFEKTGALRHPSAGVRRNAVQVMPRNARSSGAILAAGLLNDPDAQVRLAALLYLADSVPAEPVARRLLIRCAAAWLATIAGSPTQPRPPRPGTTWLF